MPTHAHTHAHTHTHTHHRPDDDCAHSYEAVWTEGSGSSGSGSGSGWSGGETETSGIYLDTVIPFPSTMAGTGTTWSLGAGGEALATAGVDASVKSHMNDGVVAARGVVDEEKDAERDDDRDWIGWMDRGSGDGGDRREDDVEMFAGSPLVESLSPNPVRSMDEYGELFHHLELSSFWLIV